MLSISIDTEVDAVYVQVSEEEVAYTRELDDCRMLDYTAAGELRGVEFLYASDGVDVRDVPMQAQIGRLLEEHGFKVLAL